jgi:GNAT superfamily N-acetyltransferase
MSPTTVTATRATTGDVPAVASVLARAFQHDPVFAWSIPDPDRRRAYLHPVFTAFAELYLPYEETYLTEDGAGAALWAPTTVDPFGGEPGETFGKRIASLLDDEESQRFLAVGELFGEHHPAQPWTYLQLIGVDPDQQRRGLGSQLLAPVLARCDATVTPAYLEASTLDNRRLYQRHGFDTISEITLPDNGPPIWLMWREPASS